MHAGYLRAAELTEPIIGVAIEVHRHFGPGLIESIYEWALLRELELRGLSTLNQQSLVIEYKGVSREEPLRFDILVEKCVLIEVKAIGDVAPIHKAQLLSYMKLMNVPIGLIINFHEAKLTNGISRLILAGAKP